MDKFEEILLQHRKDRILVVDPFGGKGDQLIYMGMEKKLRELSINYKVLRYKTMNARLFKVKKMLSLLRLHESIAEKLEYAARTTYNLIYKKVNEIRDAFADVILLRGGAYLNDLWKEYDILENVLRNSPDCAIIVAPQSFFFNSTRFSEFFYSKQKIYLFCREKYSYNLLLSMNFPENVHIHLSHDTALYLSKDDFNSRDGSYDLICPRDDKESVVDWRIEDLGKQENMKLINFTEFSTNKVILGDTDFVADFKAFVDLIENSRRVYTDRLHVAILAAILGKDTSLYPNIYHKNRGVYEFSLYKFPNVRFIDSLKFLGQKGAI